MNKNSYTPSFDESSNHNASRDASFNQQVAVHCDKLFGIATQKELDRKHCPVRVT